MKINEAKQIVNLLASEWDLGKFSSKAVGNTCAYIYLFEIMAESEKIILEKKNNKVIGLCGYIKYNSQKHRFRKKLFYHLRNILLHSPLIKNKEAMNKYNNDYDYTPKQLEGYFDGAISIIIIDKNYRGYGLGKKLIDNIFELAKNDNIKRLKILTDESCNFKFYERIGCKKVYETVIPNGEPYSNLSEFGYIYEKILR